jgi:hypothetical protein
MNYPHSVLVLGPNLNDHRDWRGAVPGQLPPSLLLKHHAVASSFESRPLGPCPLFQLPTSKQEPNLRGSRVLREDVATPAVSMDLEFQAPNLNQAEEVRERSLHSSQAVRLGPCSAARAVLPGCFRY